MKLVFILGSYLLGAFPTGYILVRIGSARDIRDLGSQSTGATNVYRVKGMAYALPVLVIDVLKGLIPVYLALQFFHSREIACFAGFAAVVGHCFPVYLRFRGGKGIATMFGTFLPLALKPVLLSMMLFILIVVVSRYVSLGSLAAALLLPFSIYIFTKDLWTILLSMAILFLVVLRHLGNIQRLLKGQERKFGQKIEIPRT